MSKLSTFNFQCSTRGTSRGFTLIETLIAIFILALTIGALLTLTAGGFFSIRYAKNDIVATNLLQESLEYIRNTRDTAALPQNNGTWSQWLSEYTSQGCNADGCIINPYSNNDDFIIRCPAPLRGGVSACEPLTYYPDPGMYAYASLSKAFQTNGTPIPTSFVRTIKFASVPTSEGDPQIIVTAQMDWMNGTNPKHLTQSITLTPWNITP